MQKKRHPTSEPPSSLPASRSPARISAITRSTFEIGREFTKVPSATPPPSRAIFRPPPGPEHLRAQRRDVDGRRPVRGRLQLEAAWTTLPRQHRTQDLDGLAHP